MSSVYRKGKKTAFIKVKNDRELRNKLLIFKDPNTISDNIADAGRDFFLSLYGSKNMQNLDNLRYQMYLMTIAKQPVQGEFKLAILPPTEAAARQHSLRVYHQVLQWYGFGKNPLKWGWKKVSGYLRPITSLAAAPEQLLCLISCSCAGECLNNCECRRSALQCSNLCTNCAGYGCSNVDISIDSDTEEDFVLADDEDVPNYFEMDSDSDESEKEER